MLNIYQLNIGRERRIGLIRADKRRIAIALDNETIALLEYNAESMGITKSELITRYLHMIGKAGGKKELLFIKHFSKGVKNNGLG